MRIIFIAWILLVSCKSALKPDMVPSASDSGYPTVEINACNTSFLGIGICKVIPNDELADLNISVQGYYKGTLQVDGCDLHQTIKYENHSKIKIPLSGQVKKSCIIDFVLSPEYPDETKSQLVIHSLKGRLRIQMVYAGIPYISESVKVKQNIEHYFTIPMYEGEVVKTYISGCDAEFNKMGQGPLIIPLSSLKLIPFVTTCIYEGIIISLRYPTRLTWQVWSYRDDFEPLPIPVVSFANDHINIKADKSVSIISVDDEYKIADHGSFNFRRDKEHTIRLITVKGRVLIGKWNQKWTWLE